MTGEAESRLKVNSFFSGIGGFELGFESHGIPTAFQCEVDSFCNSILQSRWPGVTRHSDIRTLSPDSIPTADIWTGGFPCQDVSEARGSKGRDGLNGKNSGLFFPFMDLVSKHLPKVVVLENVRGLTNSHSGKDFLVVLDALMSLGYGVAWRVLNTRYFGAPQSRPRVYIVAFHGRPDLAYSSLYEDNKSSFPTGTREGFLKSTYLRSADIYVPEIAYCLAATSGRHTGTDWSRTYVSYSDRVRRLVPEECEGLQGFPKGWTIPKTDLFEGRKDIDSYRYYSLGNAVSVPVAEWVAERVLASMKSTKLVESIDTIKSSSRFSNSQKDDQIAALREIDSKIRWNTGGVCYDGNIVSGKVSPAPVTPIRSRLADVVVRSTVDEKYFLSSNAAKGILRRVESQNRKLFPPMDNALRKLAQLNKKFDKIPAVSSPLENIVYA